MSLAAVERVVGLVEQASPRDARKVRRLLSRVAGAPEHVRPRLLAAVGVIEPALRPVVGPHEGPVCPAYPDAPPEIQARIAFGETPAQISGGLTSREAHRWLTACPSLTPAESLLAGAGTDWTVDSVPVARWIVDVLHDPERREALLRKRSVRGPHGEQIVGSYADRLDELRVPDLRPSVEATFRAAGARMWKAAEKALQQRGEPLASVPRWWRPARCARLLVTGSQLVAEGQQMRHCVAQYAGYVRDGRSVIVSLAIRDGHGLVHRSTVEIDRSTARVRQHKGPGNEAPSPLCQRALEVLSRRWQEACS